MGGFTGRGQWLARLPAWRGEGFGILLLCLCGSCPPKAPRVDAFPPDTGAGHPALLLSLPCHSVCLAAVPAKQLWTDCHVSAEFRDQPWSRVAGSWVSTGK